ncbi:MAG: DNA polymerase III subunit beta [Chlorobi bacterium]|nr:DNA polymerase III subunit beta [Chlorobiota bacterium]
MQFIISSSELLQNLQAVKPVIQTKNTNPILDNFLFDISDGRLDVYGSSGDITMRARMPLDIEEEARYAVPADKLTDILRNLPEQPLTFSFDDNHLRITAEYGKYTLPTFPGKDFPLPQPLEEAFEREIPGAQLADAVDKTAFAVFKDESRPILGGILFHFKPSAANFVSTDTRRLVVFSVKTLEGDDQQYVVPPKAAQIVKNLSGDEDPVRMRFSDRSAEFHFKNYSLTTTLLIGKYPDYELVIPKDNPYSMIVNRELFLQALKRISIFASKHTHLVKLHLSGSSLTLYARNEEMSSDAEEHMTVNYEGDDFTIGFHAKSLIEMLSHLDSEEVKMTFSSPRHASLIYPLDGLDENEEIIMLLMPLSL